MGTGPIVLIMIQTEISVDNWYTQQHTVSMSGSRLQNHICQLTNPSSWTETSKPRIQEALFLTQRLKTALVDTQRHQKQVTEYLHRELTTRVSDPQTRQRPKTLQQRASKQTEVFKTETNENCTDTSHHRD